MWFTDLQQALRGRRVYLGGTGGWGHTYAGAAPLRRYVHHHTFCTTGRPGEGPRDTTTLLLPQVVRGRVPGTLLLPPLKHPAFPCLSLYSYPHLFPPSSSLSSFFSSLYLISLTLIVPFVPCLMVIYSGDHCVQWWMNSGGVQSSYVSWDKVYYGVYSSVVLSHTVLVTIQYIPTYTHTHTHTPHVLPIQSAKTGRCKRKKTFASEFAIGLILYSYHSSVQKHGLISRLDCS